jgi:hypothetical protein
MSQFGRPESDTTNQGYTSDLGVEINLYGSINEVTEDQDDYVRSALAPTNDVYVVRLSRLTDPDTDSGHTLHYTYAKSESLGSQVDVTVQLRQSYITEGTPGSLITAQTHTDIGATPTTVAWSLSTTAVSSITSYPSLYMRFVFNQP